MINADALLLSFIDIEPFEIVDTHKDNEEWFHVYELEVEAA
jgi:hypothetical protein